MKKPSQWRVSLTMIVWVQVALEPQENWSQSTCRAPVLERTLSEKHAEGLRIGIVSCKSGTKM